MCRLLQSLLVLKGLIMLCILVDFPIYVYIDTKSKGLPILYFKGSQVDASKLWCISVPEDRFNLCKQCRCCISSCFSLFAKVPVWEGGRIQRVEMGDSTKTSVIGFTEIYLKFLETMRV